MFSKNLLALACIAAVAAPIAIGNAKGKPTPDRILPYKHTCSSTLKFQAQDMTGQQFSDSCQILGVQESYFHNKLSTNYQPIVNDVNDDLLMVIFDDYRNYNRYGSRLFGINTNNGGMYIEGNAEDPNNQATFYAHEADWERPDFVIWNLEHEYVHYLDGRFDLKGNFSDYPQSTVFWSEGLAEYIALKDNNNEAKALISTNGGNRTLSQVFATNYSNSSDEIYRWGYLGVRFLFENNINDIATIRSLTTTGDWSGYQNELNAMAAQYETQWQNWLISLKNS
ncbi:collagenase [Thalassotalea ganghwensis]